MVKRERPEGYPKRPVSGFIRYMNSNRLEFAKQVTCEGSNVTSVSRVAKEAWRDLDDGTRDTWNAQAKLDIDDYNKQVKKFYEDNPPVKPETEKPVKKQKRVRPLGTPKKTGSSYIVFSTAERQNTIAELSEAGIEVNFATIAKKTSEKWHKKTDEQKKPWQDAAAALVEAAKLDALKELEDAQVVVDDEPETVVVETDALNTEPVPEPVTETAPEPVTSDPEPVTPDPEPVTNEPVPAPETTKPKRKYVRKAQKTN